MRRNKQKMAAKQGGESLLCCDYLNERQSRRNVRIKSITMRFYSGQEFFGFYEKNIFVVLQKSLSVVSVVNNKTLHN